MDIYGHFHIHPLNVKLSSGWGHANLQHSTHLELNLVTSSCETQNCDASFQFSPFKCTKMYRLDVRMCTGLKTPDGPTLYPALCRGSQKIEKEKIERRLLWTKTIRSNLKHRVTGRLDTVNRKIAASVPKVTSGHDRSPVVFRQ